MARSHVSRTFSSAWRQFWKTSTNSSCGLLLYSTCFVEFPNKLSLAKLKPLPIYEMYYISDKAINLGKGARPFHPEQNYPGKLEQTMDRGDGSLAMLFVGRACSFISSFVSWKKPVAYSLCDPACNLLYSLISECTHICGHTSRIVSLHVEIPNNHFQYLVLIQSPVQRYHPSFIHVRLT